MALPNGVLVHGPTSWACAVRLPGRRAEGRDRARSASGPRMSSARSCAARRGSPRLFALLPQVRRSVPEAKLPFERRERARRRCSRAPRRPARARLEADRARRRRRSSPGCSRSRRPRSRCAAPTSPPTTAPSTSRSAPTSTASARDKEHERCGGHLVGPLIATIAVGGALAHRVPRARPRRRPARPRALGALAASTEIFGWMTRHPDHALSKVLGRPATSSSTGSRPPSRRRTQLEVAEAALAACLELEHAAARYAWRRRRASGSRPRSSTSRSRRCATATTPTRTSTTPARRCSRTAATRGS